MRKATKIFLVIFFLVLTVAVIAYLLLDYPKKNKCNEFPYYECPSGCVVCPPCEVCSSLSCQSEEFCEGIGFDKGWYDSLEKK